MADQNRIECVQYESRHEAEWDEFLDGSGQHSVLQSRAFLGYHGNRFEDRSIVIIDRLSKRIVGVMPAAIHPQEPEIVVSHPGSTFGGLLLGGVDPTYFGTTFELVLRHFREIGFKTLRYKTTPSFVFRQPDETESYHGLAHGRLVRCDLWSVLRLSGGYRFHQKRRASIAAAKRNGLVVRATSDEADWQAFYDVLQANLRDRHDTSPVHTAEELLDLKRRLGTKSQLLIATTANGEIASGVWMIDYQHGVSHTQYIASTAEGRKTNAVDLVLGEAIESAAARGYSHFSFGVSSERDGSLNDSLLKFKLRFDAGVVNYMIFDFALR